MSAPRLLAPTTISGGVPTAGAGTLNTIALWTPDGNTLGNSLLTQSGNIVTNASGAIRALGTTQTSPAFTRHDTTTSGIYFPATNEIGFTISNQHAMFISSGRNVSIGTVGPTAKLHVTQGSSPNFANLLIGSAGTSTNFYDANEHYFRNGSLATGMYMGSLGNVGIGTTSPANGLHVVTPAGGTTSGGQITQENTATSSYRWMTAVGGGDNAWVSGRGWFLRDMTAGATRLVCDTSGNVGIGTASPGTRLDVANAGNVIVRAQNTTSNSDAQFNAVNTFGTATFGINNVGGYALTASAIPFLFYTNNTERARIDSAGRLLVGASTAPIAAGARILASANAAGINTGVQINSGTNAAGTGIIINGRATGGADFFYYTGGIGSESYFPIVSMTTTELDASLRSGYGLKLPATPGNADTQTLDAYQEGTVTATITTTTGTVTLVASLNTLRYTRIGRMVNVQGYLEVQSVTGPPTGDFVINGLPATIGTGSQSNATGAAWTNNMAAGYTGTAVAVTLVGTTTLSIRRITTAGVNATDFGTYTQAGTAISISVWYSV